MSARGLLCAVTGAAFLLCGLAISNALLLLTGLLCLVLLFFSLLSVLLARFTFRLSQYLNSHECPRRQDTELIATMHLFAPLPISPLEFTVRLPARRDAQYTLPMRPLGETKSVTPVICGHVGLYRVGITRVLFMDCLGLFSLSRRIPAPLPELVVFPGAPEVSPVQIRQSPEGTHGLAASDPDYTTPEGIRSYVQGDELKRIHWKLSARRQELLVRTYEQAQRPDCLVLLNTHELPWPQAQRYLATDALTESLCGAVRQLLSQGHPVLLPLPSGRSFSASTLRRLPQLQRFLAEIPFTDSLPFEDALRLALPRLSRTDTLLVFSAEITPGIADMLTALCHLDIKIRFTLACPKAPDSDTLSLLRLLVAAGIDTFQVTLEQQAAPQGPGSQRQ